MSAYRELNAEDAHRAASRLEAAARSANQAADRLEDATRTLTRLLDSGYGNNAERLIELLSSMNAQPPAP